MRVICTLGFALATSSCLAVLGLDYDPRSREVASPTLPDGQVDPSESSTRTTSAVDAASDVATDAAEAGAPAIESEQMRLATLRVRVADAPSLGDYFASQGWLYWTINTNTWTRRRIPSTETWPIPFRMTHANDTLTITGARSEPATIRDAASGTALAQIDRGTPNPIAVDDGVVLFSVAPSSFDKLDVHIWRAASPPTRTKVGTIGTGSADTVGYDATHVYVRDVATPTRLWIVDVGASSVSSVAVTASPQSVTRTDDGVVLATVIGGELRLTLLAPQAIDLDAEIAAADCIVPPSERAAFGSHPMGFGPWLIFTTRGGLLAYRHADNRLVPIQIRLPTDNYIYSWPQLVRATRAVAFNLSAPQGLYYVPLDAVLP